MFDKTQPLGLPKGSVRALIALGVVTGALAGLAGAKELALMIVGFYFGSKVPKG
jgi:hypothetical protein